MSTHCKEQNLKKIMTICLKQKRYLRSKMSEKCPENSQFLV